MASFPLNKYLSFKTSLDFNISSMAIMEPKVVDSTLEFSINPAISPLKRETRGGYIVRLIGDGIFAPTFNGIKPHGKSEPFDTTQGAINLVEFTYDGYDYYYRIYSPMKPILTEGELTPAITLTNTTITTNEEDLINLEGVEVTVGDRVSIFSLVTFTQAEEVVVIDNPQFGANDRMDAFGRQIDVNLDYAIVASNDDLPTEKQGMVSVYDSTNGSLIRHIQDPSGNNRSYKQFGTGLCLDDHFMSVGYKTQWSEAAYYMDVVTGEVIHELSRLSVPGNTESDYFAQATAMSEDRIFVGAPGGNYIAVFNRETGAYIERIENNDTASGFGSHIQVDQENNILITRSDSDVCVHVLDLTTYENIYVVNAGGGSTSSSVFVYDGLLYVGVPQNYGGDGYVNVYDYQAQQLVTTITSPNPHWAMENFGISISASGRTLFVLDGYRPYDDGVQPRKYEHGAIFGLSLDNDYEETIFWQDYNWQPIGDHIKVFGDKMILGSPAYLDDDGDIVAGKVRIFKLNSLT